VNTPAVSVLMATYNGSRYLRGAIDSVLGQTHDALELIVADDCSSDDTVSIVEEFARAEPDRVRLVRSRVREGPCRARNRALDLARGPLVCWLDQDDVWLETKVEEQFQLMTARPEVGLVYSYFDAFDSDSGATVESGDGRRDIEGDVLGELFLFGCFIGSLTTMFRREALERRDVRLRERDFSLGDDYYLWLMIALDWQVARIPHVLARYRRHTANESSRMAATSNVAAWRVNLLREFLGEFPEAVPRLGRQRRVGLAWHALVAMQFELQARRRVTALRLGMQALGWSPRTALRTSWGRAPLSSADSRTPHPSREMASPDPR
jgi:glycosyltransferase involved in cell wall biosynthesis